MTTDQLISLLLEKDGYQKISLETLKDLKDLFPEVPLFTASFKKKVKNQNNTSVGVQTKNVKVAKRLKKVLKQNQILKEEDEKETTEPVFVSETLANLYYDQNNFKEALQMYEQLYLKYPEKRVSFAVRIKEIKQKL